MKRKWLAIGISTVSVILLVLTSLSNVVGYQTVQTSQQNLIKERISQRELLFQTICDIANNKEIQRIILESQISRGIFPTSELPIVTKNQLKMMYFMGLILSKFVSKSKMQSIMVKYPFDNHKIQMEISAVIEMNLTLKGEITQLQQFNCDCGNENFLRWNFPLICGILLYVGGIGVILMFFQGLNIIGMIILSIILPLIKIFNCI
jgi:hypothetical protein